MLEHQRGQWPERLDGLEFGDQSAQSVGSFVTADPVRVTLRHSTEADATASDDMRPRLFTGVYYLDEPETLSRDGQRPDPRMGSWAEAERQYCAEFRVPAPRNDDTDTLDLGQQHTRAAYVERNAYRLSVVSSAVMGALVFAAAVPLLHNTGTGGSPTSHQTSLLQTGQWSEEETVAGISSPLGQKIDDRWPSEAPVKRNRLPSGQEVAAASPTASLDATPIDQPERQKTPAAPANPSPPPKLDAARAAPAAALDVPARVRTFIVYPDGTVVDRSDATSELARAAEEAISAAAPEANDDSTSAQPDVQTLPAIKPETTTNARGEAAPEQPPSAPAPQDLAQRAPPDSDPVPLPTRKPLVARAASAAPTSPSPSAQPSFPSSAPQWQQEVFAR